MQVILLKQFVGHVAGSKVSVSDERAYLWMVQKICKPDNDFLYARQKEIKRLIAKSEKADKKNKGEKL